MTATTVPTRPAALPMPALGRRSWHVAARLARREVRRRWGRTLLVMVLVAVPVFGMTVVTVLVRTTPTSPERAFANQFGAADLVSTSAAPPPPGGWPAGTHVVTGRSIGSLGILAADGTARVVQVLDIDLNNPVTRGAVLLRAGRFPARAGEALVSPKIARAFHVGIGDQLRLKQPAWSERIVGIGVAASNWSDGLVAVRGNELGQQLGFTFEQVQPLTLVDLPGHPSTAQLKQYPPQYISAADLNQSKASQRAVNWTIVSGAIALAIVGVVISGAFAVGARRQLVTLGQLSANGADEPQLRRLLSLQGVWSGALGTGLGLVGAVVTLTLMHDRINGWIHRDIGPYVWTARDLVAIAVTGVVAATVAAFIPARTAARVPVLSALAGRRPLGAIPRVIVPIGAALFAGGVLVLTLVATASRNGSGGDSLALAAVLGGLLALSGACCVSPVVVASLARLGRVVRGAGRVAVRSVVRSRASSAAVVMALVAINAGAIAIATAFSSHTVQSAPAAAFMPDNALIVTQAARTDVGAVSAYLPIPQSVERTLRTILPKATWAERRVVLNSTIRGGGVGRYSDGTKIIAVVDTREMVVADPAILRLIGLSPADNATLQRDGVIMLPSPDDTNTSPGDRVRIQVGTGAGARTLSAARTSHPMRATAATSILITPAKARELGLPMVAAGEIVTNPTSFDESQRASIDALLPSLLYGPVAKDAPLTAPSLDVLWSGPRSTALSASTVRQILLAIVVVIALIVLAISLSLSAAETRDERDVLVALGARPRTMRSVAAWKAALLSFTGAAIAVPTGFIPVAFVFAAAVRPGEHARLVFPWSTVGELVLAAPLIAACIAAVGSAIAQRARPTQMSTFATD
jgi:putative ABC transport system permease protein